MIEDKILDAIGLSIVFTSILLGIIILGISYLALKFLKKERKILSGQSFFIFVWAVFLFLENLFYSQENIRNSLLIIGFGGLIILSFFFIVPKLWNKLNKVLLVLILFFGILGIVLMTLHLFGENICILFYKICIMLPVPLAFFDTIKFIIKNT